VRRNWSANLARVPDLRWDLLAACFGADAAWCEWRWHGTRFDGGRFEMQGVVIYGIEARRIVRGRLYMGDLPDDTNGALFGERYVSFGVKGELEERGTGSFEL
jgi:hypothetical protein